MSALTDNPIHCMQCNLEVPPETLALSEEIAQQVAHWNALYHAIDVLWLDSGAYEVWAHGQLADLTSAVNTLGRAVQRVLNDTHRCYYWYFQDQSAENFVPLRTCPVCGETLLDYRAGIFLQRVCERDGLVAVGE
jgi:predicted  nucleic acid-binding Zn ribbon protein